MNTIHTHWDTLHGDHFRGLRVCVTGAGFIGSHLAEALVSLGAQVIVIDDLSGGSLDNLETFARGLKVLEFVEASILNRSMLSRCIDGCQYVFHLAALGSVPRSVEKPALYNDVNTLGTLHVLEAARAAKGNSVRRVVFAASSSAYGDNAVPWVESMPVLPKSPYAATKVAGEALLRAYSNSYGLDTASLRYFNIFGPRQNANSAYAAVIAAFAKALLAGTAPLIYGDGLQSRDFTFVHNAVHANLLAARHAGPLNGEVFNVGCGGSVTVNELAGMMAHMLDRPQLAPEYQAERAGDLKHSYADLGKSQTILDYRPIINFEIGLRATVQWYVSQMSLAHPASLLAGLSPGRTPQ